MKTARHKDPKSEIQNQVAKRRIRRLLACALATGLVAYLAVIHLVPRLFDLPYQLVHSPLPGLEVSDRHGTPLRHFLAGEQRVDPPATLSEIPAALIAATLAVEDSRFYHHNGVDYAGILRAVRDAVLHRRVVSGASTVSQQLIKITSDSRPRNLRTKVIETLGARRLEQLWDKDRILAAYLNRLPYGNQLIGCRAAARGYFSKPLGDLSLAECALLAGLPNKPSRLNPNLNFDGARQRQAHVLQRMLDEEMITDAEYRNALAEPIRLIGRARQPFRAPHLVELVVSDLPPDFFTPERRIRTTLDAALQLFAEQTLLDRLGELDQNLGGEQLAQAAAVVIDNASGEVLALAGSRDFFDSPGGQINGAWTPRSPGSALKPFTYLVALEGGHTAASILPDLPVSYMTPTGAYQPVNFDRRFHGPVTLRHALANSLNVPAVRLLEDIGGPAALHRALREVGLTTLNDDPATYGLGLTLGTAEVRLLELANAYACLARLGRYAPLRLSLSSDDDRAGVRGSLATTQVFSADAAYILADILSDNPARAEAFGLYSPLRFDGGLRVACKTGTSTDFRDNWCLGFTPDYTVGVWVGRFDNQPMRDISGVSGAGPIFHDLMQRLHRDSTSHWYEAPSTLVEATIDPLNGKRIGDGGAVLARHRRQEIFRDSQHLPPLATRDDYEAFTGRTLLSLEYTAWLGGAGVHLQNRAALAPQEAPALAATSFKILSPIAGTTAYLDPDLPDSGRFFPLEVSGASARSIEWRSDTLAIDRSDSEVPLAILTPGAHRITARDSGSGIEQSVAFVVESL